MHNQQPKLNNPNFQQMNYQNNLPFNTNNVVTPAMYSNESQQNYNNLQPKFSQQNMQQQPVFFPSALNRKLNSNHQNENNLNQHTLTANNQMMFNKNRNIVLNQEHHQKQQNTNNNFNQHFKQINNYFNANNENSSYCTNQQLFNNKTNNNTMNKLLNGNQNRTTFDNFESNSNSFMNRNQLTSRPYQFEQNFVQQQLNQNQLTLNTSNQQPFSLFNSSSNFDELNSMLQQNTKTIKDRS